MKKQFTNTIIFLVVTGSAILVGRSFSDFLENSAISIAEKNYSLLNPSKENIFTNNKKSIKRLLPLLTKYKNTKNDFNGTEEAIKVLKEILKEIPKLSISNNQKEVFTSILLRQIAENYESISSLEEAVDYYLKSVNNNIITLQPFKEKGQVIIPTYLKLASLYNKAGEYSQAKGALIYALELLKENGQADSFILYEILNSFGEIFASQEKYADAEEYYIRSIAHIKKFNDEHPLIKKVEFNLINAYNKQGKYKEAEYLLLKLIDEGYTFDSEFLFTASEVLKNRGRYKIAEQLLISNLGIREKELGNEHPETLKIISHLASLYDSQYLFSKSQPYHIKLLGSENLNKILPINLRINILNNIAYNFMARGNYSIPEELLKAQIKMNNLLYEEEYNLNASQFVNLGLLYSLQGKHKESIDYFNKAIRKSLFYIQREAQSLLLTERQRLIKSQVIQYMMPFSWALDDDSYKEITLFSRLNHQGLLQEIERRQAKSAVSKASGIQLKKEIKLLTTKISNLNNNPEKLKFLIAKKRAKEKLLYYEIPSLKPKLVEINEVANVIPEDGVLVEFQKYDTSWKDPFNKINPKESYLAITLKSNGVIDVIDLGSAEKINEKINEALFSTNQGNESALKLWNEVGDLILMPLRETLTSHKKVFISPDAELNQIPFAALGDLNGEGFLNDNIKIHLLTTGRELLEFEKHQNHTTDQPLVLANPNFNKKNISLGLSKPRSNHQASNRSNLRLTKNTKWEKLPETVNEGEVIKELINAELLVENDATATAIQSKEIAPKILHIASHAFYDQQLSSIVENSLQNSGIVLAGANESNAYSNDDGYLTALEISKLNWDGMELVVISGCQSGLGDLLLGEGVYGLKRAIAVAGARSSLLSLWKVDDEATSVFMQTFYKRLVSGVSKADALVLTQRDFRSGRIKSNDPKKYDWRKPYYWAAFQLSGDWRPIKFR